ncbi:hypothetical protein [Synechococcus sp. BS55D]|uniref:hypothetical protein n=1 Tax=Synechococcus sp. BS55D TaxID=2055943 RepID=UPI001F3DB036|nr:hypothetical protein [Synechococcus sp. BS55D]
MLELPTHPWNLAGITASSDRDALARFWLAAPQDLLPSLWSSPLGDATKQLVRQLDPQFSFTPAQVSLRTAIGERLQAGFQAPMAVQLLIVNFLYSPPGLLRISNPQTNLPGWLLADYQSLYETGPSMSAPAVQPPTPTPSQAQQAPATGLPQPDFGVFPATLQELIGNRIQLNRLLGLSNLYYIDPEDQEILQELRQVRFGLIEAIERCPESELQQIWATDLGDRYWALVRSGVQKEALTPVEEHKKHAVTQALNPASGGGFGRQGALNAFLIAMVLFEPGTMRVDGAEHKLPGWLFPHYQQVFAESLPAQQA